MQHSWKSLEDHVRGIAGLRWNAPCRSEHIDGVDFDGVVHVSADETILIEITKERDLDKVRSDLNKIKPTKLRLATDGLICRGFVILADEPTASMIEMGEKSHIAVMSAAAFERSFFDFDAYNKLRSRLPFGSAIDSKTGENDSRNFVPVRYSLAGGHGSLAVEDLVSQLLRGRRVVLTGDFGTGKSRCIKELYSSLSHRIKDAGAFPVAVNLRDHWSSSNALEILAGHLGNIGLSSSIDNVVRLLNAGHLILLLDGFDEIGTQSHDMRVDDRKALRRHAVRGLRDLISKTKAGVIVTGRSHFFDSDEEMLQSLGLNVAREDSIVATSPDSFTMSEGAEYLSTLGIVTPIPNWLPRKPLVFQILVELDRNEVSKLLTKQHGEFEFWGMFINAVCVRESRGVADSIAPETIRQILLDLAGKSRHSTAFRGRLSPRDIDESYERAVGTAPDQTGRQLLSRMCTLGRIEPESPDRQFVDYSVVDVLRAERLIAETVSLTDHDTQCQWKQSLRVMGAVHGASLVRAFSLDTAFFSFLRKFGSTANTKRLGEIVSILTVFGDERLDFQGLQLSATEVPLLNLSSRVVTNLTLKNAMIGLLALDNSPVRDSDNLQIIDSLVGLAAGVSSVAGLPDWVKGTEVIDFDRISNAARIKESPILPQHRLLLAIVHKIFFQPGGGREEGALLKGGYGQKYSPKLVDAIIRLLMRDGLIERFKGDDGWVYKPVRRYTERMNKMRSELTLSEDTLWSEVASLRES